MVRAISQERTITAEVTGTDRFKYFRRPVTETKDGPQNEATRFPLLGLENVTSLGLLAPPTTAQKPPTRYAASQVRGTQTDYRESEAQTIPWTPPYTTHGDSTPEVLHLDQLSWGNGLPPGKHEVEIVERLRRKRAWESQLPPLDCQENINIRFKLIAEMEKSNWLFREREIEAVHKERMKKSEQLLEEHNLMNRSRLTCRMEFLEDDINKRKEQKLHIIRHEKERALRKLCMKEKGYNPKKCKMSVLDEYLKRSSELYAPMRRNGISSKNRNETLAQKQFTIDNGDICDFEYAPSYRPVFDFNKASQPKKQTELCVRETRWTIDNLVSLHQDLQKLRAKSSKVDTFYSLAEERPKPSVRAQIKALPCSKRVLGEDTLYQAALTIQRVVHSRSMQSLMEQKRECWKELMQELKTSRFGVSVPDISSAREESLLQARLTGVLDNIIGLNVGTSIGQTLYLLATELLRFKNEGIAHSQALQAEAARWRRELPEEGRRQREMRRREEHNLMFAQLVEVYQDSINGFMSELVAQARENEAKRQAYEHGKEVARLAELERLGRPPPEPEGLVSADLLFELIAPEGLRELARTCLLILKQKYQEARKCLGERTESELSEVNIGGPENEMEQRDYPDEEKSSVIERLSEQPSDLNVAEPTDSVQSEQLRDSLATEPTDSVQSDQLRDSLVTKSTVSVKSEQPRDSTVTESTVSEQLRDSLVTESTVSVKSEQLSDSLVTKSTVSVKSEQPRDSTVTESTVSEQLRSSLVTESTISVESQSQETNSLLLADGTERLEIEDLASSIVKAALTSASEPSDVYSEVHDVVSSLVTSAEADVDPQCRKFVLQGAPEPRSAEDRLLARVMRDMCYVASSLLHTAANILNKAIQLAGIPQESFDEALRRTMLVVNGALEEVIGLILPKKSEEKQPLSEDILIEASRIVDDILQKAKHRIAEMKEKNRLNMATLEAEYHAKAIVEDVISEAQQKVLQMIVEDFLADLIEEAMNKVDASEN